MKSVLIAAVLFNLITVLKAGDVNITFIISDLPVNTPDQAVLYLAGNFNNWSAGSEKYKLSLFGDHYSISLAFPVNSVLEFKFTRGSWLSVEKGSIGEEIPNRRFTVSEINDTVYVDIDSWRDFSESSPPVNSTTSGDIRYHENFYIPQLKRYRTIRVYLPPDYDTTDELYAVLYMHDGQNIFDKATAFAGEWQVDDSLQKLYYDNIMNGVIVVGIDNDGDKRLDEYSPWFNPNLQKGGEGAAYIEFLVNTLKPWIDNHYRTKPQSRHTAIAGSSMGGLISLYAGCRYPYVFSKIGAFSPAFWFAKDQLIAFIKEYPLLDKSKIYIDTGTEEGNNDFQKKAYFSDAKEIQKLLIDMGLPEENTKLIIDEGASHNEAAWAKRFPAAIQWLLH